MTLYHLDANIVSDLVRNPDGKVASTIRERGDPVLAISIIVRCEIEFGLVQKGNNTLRQRVEDVISEMRIVDLAAPVHEYYGRLRTELKRLGTPIGPNDLLIAAHALSLGAILVTANEREFSRVPGLKIENWLRAS